ncbi:IS3 family transposase, partial [Escherichia coli]|uniref:IS3 family transposase n=1 Tax=Escherichia coli TaxID=562 RepID=UPI00202937C1
SSASSLSSGEYLPGSLQGKISSDGCLKKEQMVVSAIASTPHISVIREYIEIFYNRQRRHSRLGNISPAAFREKYHQIAA